VLESCDKFIITYQRLILWLFGFNLPKKQNGVFQEARDWGPRSHTSYVMMFLGQYGSVASWCWLLVKVASWLDDENVGDCHWWWRIFWRKGSCLAYKWQSNVKVCLTILLINASLNLNYSIFKFRKVNFGGQWFQGPPTKHGGDPI
jgi:hypothetical protein